MSNSEDTLKADQHDKYENSAGAVWIILFMSRSIKIISISDSTYTKKPESSEAII